MNSQIILLAFLLAVLIVITIFFKKSFGKGLQNEYMTLLRDQLAAMKEQNELFRIMAKDVKRIADALEKDSGTGGNLVI